MRPIHVFLGVDLRCGHMGLKKIAKSKGVDIPSLTQGQAVIFVNRSKNKLKAFSHNNVISYYMPKDPRQAIDFAAFDEIPKAFAKDGTMDFTKALRESLQKRLRLKKPIEDVEVL